MRRPLVALSLLSCFGLVACEDGPTQTFQPAPAGAGSVWNDGNSAPIADPTQQGFTTQGGGQNLQVICNAAKEQKVWANMVQAPIAPPTVVAQLDMAGLDPTGKIETWNGLTIEAAEQINCQSTNIGDYFGDGNQDNYWGDDEEVIAEYLVSNHLIDEITLNLGYQGTLAFTSRDGTNHYSMPLGTPIQKNNEPYPALQWAVSGYGFGQSPAMNAQVNELYDALIATFAPTLPSVPDCQAAGLCVVNHFGQVAYIFITPLGIGPEVASYAAGYPTTNTVVQYQMYGAKIMPYSLANQLLKLDGPGVLASAGLLNKGSTTPCTLQMGLTFSNFLSECVSVTPGDTVDYDKEVGALSHDDETWTFNVQGVDLNFKDESLAPTQVVLDKTVPGSNDLSVNFTIDQSALGNLANDWAGDVADPLKSTEDLHGSGLVYLQYAQNVQNALNQYNVAAGVPTHPLGDPACTTQAINAANPGQPNFAAGCTGFEGFVTAAPVSYPTTGTTIWPANALGLNVLAIDGGLGLGLKCGTPDATFCLDANGILNVNPTTGAPTAAGGGGYTLCASSQGGAQGSLWSTSYTRVLQVFGKGNVANLPPDVQDVRFFWKQYVIAMIQYMEAAGTGADGSAAPNETETGVAAQVVDLDELFFDSQGAGQYEIGEYVDRRYASATQPPTDVNITADIRDGIFNDYAFSRELYRGESAIYAAVLENPSDGIGQENTALLSNVFGSAVLTAAPVGMAGWQGSSDGTVSAYQCATDVAGAFAVQCGGQLVPLDASGKALLLPYQGAFAPTAFGLGPTPIEITATFSDIQQATVLIPIYTSPYGWGLDGNGAPAYSGTGTMSAALSTLIPWTPQQSGIGFSIPITGTLSKFVETANLDFSGTTISASVDYTPVIDPSTLLPMTDGSIQFDAVETTDFLGAVFLCQDSVTGDLLTARMYDTVAGIENWFLAHQGAYADCGMITTYSPYDNYADYITSVTNGVTLNITQGGGYGRVVDVTLFVPGQ